MKTLFILLLYIGNNNLVDGVEILLKLLKERSCGNTTNQEAKEKHILPSTDEIKQYLSKYRKPLSFAKNTRI